MKYLKDFNLNGKRVLVRCDFNVPLDKKGNISDDFKIKKTLPTIKYLIGQKAKVILMSHLGEPEGKIVPELKLDKIAEKLAEDLDCSITKEDDCVGPQIESDVNKLAGGQVMLLENLRFHKEEMENNIEFIKHLSMLGDIFVNDAFGVCHRDESSVTGLPKILPSCAGFLLAKEIEDLDRILKNPEKPMIAIIGGKKVETKSRFINNISRVADFVIVSGLIEEDVQEKNIKFLYPDKIIAPKGELSSPDINIESIKIFQEKILQAKTVLWNGPFGKIEDDTDSAGTLAIANAIIKSKAFSVVGGGETVEFLTKQGIIENFSHVSTGGGAMLSYLGGEKLPGIEVLK